MIRIRVSFHLDHQINVSSHTGTPPDLFKPLSAFANRQGGGILLFGLDEDAGFKVMGVGNPRKLQEDLSGLAAQI